MKPRLLVSAFSLIELLVTVSIIAIVSVIVLAGLTSGRAEKEVEGAAQQVASALRDAQNKSLTGTTFVANTTPCYYRFTWSGAGGTIVYVYKNGSDCSSTTTATVATIALANGVTFSNSGTVQYSLPNGKLSSTTSIVLSKSGTTKTVCAESSGLVSVVAGSGGC